MAGIVLVDPTPAEREALALWPDCRVLGAAELAAGAWGGPDGPDAVVVGSAAARPLDLARLAHRTHPDAAVVVLAAAADADRLRRAAAYTPGMPTGLRVASLAGELVGEVAEAAAAAAKARRHRLLVAAVAARMQGGEHQAAAVQAPLGTLLDHASIGVALVDPLGRLLSWNDRAATLLELGADARGVPLSDYVADPQPVAAALTAAAAGAGADAPVAVAGPTPEVALELTAAPTRLDDGRNAVLALLLDVTDRRATERARDELTARLERARLAQAFLLRASDVLARASGYLETLRMLAAVAVPTLGDLCLIDVLDDDGVLQRVVAHHADPARRPLAEELRRRYPPVMGGPHPGVQAIGARHSRWSAVLSDEFLRLTTHDERHFELLKELEFTSYISVPLVTETEVLGSVTLVSSGSGRHFDAEDVALAENLADRVALVVAKARRYEEEHRIAEALQRSLLSPLPEVPPLRLAARYVAARQGSRVGGDWYDAFTLPDGRLAVIIGDVVGHDLGAAARMGQLRNALRSLAWDRAGSPADTLDRLDALNTGLGIAELATVVYAIVDVPGVDGCRLEWANAGHLPPLLVTADGAAEFLDENLGVLLGVPVADPRSDAVRALPPGATLLLYTDGLVESRADQLERGLPQLERLAASLAGRPLQELCDALLAELAADPDDDVALVAVRLPGPGPGH